MPLASFQQLRDIYAVQESGKIDAIPQDHPVRAMVGDVVALQEARRLPPPGKLDDPNAIGPEDFRFALADKLVGAPQPIAHRVAGVEAGFHGSDPNATAFAPDIVSGQRASSKGARGLMQFTPETGAAFGLTPETFGSPTAQLEAYTRFVGDELKSRYGNDWRKILAHYNGGGLLPPAALNYADTILRAVQPPSDAGVPSTPTETPTSYRDPLMGLGKRPEGVLQTTGARALRTAETAGRGIKRLGRVVAEGITPQAIPEIARAGGEAATGLTLTSPFLPLAGGAAEAATGSPLAGDVAEIGTAMVPLGLAATGRLAASVPGVARKIHARGFSPRAQQSYGALAGGEFPREAGKFVKYMTPASDAEKVLLRRVNAGDTGTLQAFRVILETAIGGAAGGPLGALIAPLAGERGLKLVAPIARAALTNPATAPLTRQLMSLPAGSAEYGRLAGTLVKTLAETGVLQTPPRQLERRAD